MPPLCSGIAADVRGRLPYYVDDWAAGCSSKALAATVFIFFSNALPALTFASYLATQTDNAIGVVEVLLSMGIGGLLFAIAAGQPLVIVGVTGPVCIFLATLYDLSVRFGLPYLGWLSWVCAWSAVMHITLGVCNACWLVAYVTPFSADIFGLLISVIYVYQGAAGLARAFYDGDPLASALLALLLGLCTCFTACVLARARTWVLWSARARGFLADYGPPLSIVVFSAAQYLPAFSATALPALRVPSSVGPSSPRTTAGGWVPAFWAVPTWGVFAAVLPAVVLTSLLFFDHNISAMLSQRKEFHLRKPPAYNLDTALLGVSVCIAGVLGLPPNYGLLPQAPLHVRALATISHHQAGALHVERWVAVCETRVSAAGQSILLLVMLSPPFLFLLGRVPLGVLAGQFLFLGLAGAQGNGLVARALFLLMDRSGAADVRAAPYADTPLAHTAAITVLQLAAVGAIFAATLTPAGVVFPVLIVLLVPLRLWGLPRCFTRAALAALDPLPGEGEEGVSPIDGGGDVAASTSPVDDGMMRNSPRLARDYTPTLQRVRGESGGEGGCASLSDGGGVGSETPLSEASTSLSMVWRGGGGGGGVGGQMAGDIDSRGSAGSP